MDTGEEDTRRRSSSRRSPGGARPTRQCEISEKRRACSWYGSHLVARGSMRNLHLNKADVRAWLHLLQRDASTIGSVTARETQHTRDERRAKQLANHLIYRMPNRRADR